MNDTSGRSHERGRCSGEGGPEGPSVNTPRRGRKPGRNRRPARGDSDEPNPPHRASLSENVPVTDDPVAELRARRELADAEARWSDAESRRLDAERNLVAEQNRQRVLAGVRRWLLPIAAVGLGVAAYVVSPHPRLPVAEPSLLATLAAGYLAGQARQRR